MLSLIPAILTLLTPAPLTLASSPSFSPKPESNGMHLFAPTTLLVSLDGLRAGQITERTPALLRLARQGVRAESLEPVFPTLTFPNHWSIMTGLLPRHHGIIGNDFFDPSSGRSFKYTDPAKSLEAFWWGGEPLWATAEKQRVKSAVLMWPGPPRTSEGVSPTYHVPYANIHPTQKLSHIAAWLDKPLAERPQLIAAYLPDVDQAGHVSGPDGPAVHAALERVDAFVGDLLDLLEARNLTSIINLLVLSDHGMAPTSQEQLIILDDLVPPRLLSCISHSDIWPLSALRLLSPTCLAPLHSALQSAASASGGAFEVYTRQTLPRRWGYAPEQEAEGTADLWIVPALGWSVTSRAELEVLMEGVYRPGGNHGWDNAYPDMQAAFLLSGPFASLLRNRRGVPDPARLEKFSNVEVYALGARLLGLKPAQRTDGGGWGFWDELLEGREE